MSLADGLSFPDPLPAFRHRDIEPLSVVEIRQ